MKPGRLYRPIYLGIAPDVLAQYAVPAFCAVHG